MNTNLRLSSRRFGDGSSFIFSFYISFQKAHSKTSASFADKPKRKREVISALYVREVFHGFHKRKPLLLTLRGGAWNLSGGVKLCGKASSLIGVEKEAIKPILKLSHEL
jgi:hypothetical protein